ncbi:MAG: cytidylate kinase-like family protein [Candidatus Competibacteraceae bacterium]|nr:cytidylate kinase-like family protein [Candidatus Competibacteraceae bacterium]
MIILEGTPSGSTGRPGSGGGSYVHRLHQPPALRSWRRDRPRSRGENRVPLRRAGRPRGQARRARPGPEQRSHYDEKKPGLWAGISRSRDQYIHYLKTIFFEEATAGNCVFVGRGAASVLSTVPGVLSVLLVSDREQRLKRAQARFDCDERAAEHALRQSDHDRSGFHRYFFGQDWKDASCYDLVINTGRGTAAAAAEVIARCRELRSNPDDDRLGLERIAELYLGNRVVTALVFERKLPVQALEVNVSGRVVTLHGFVTVPRWPRRRRKRRERSKASNRWFSSCRSCRPR